MGGGPGDAAVDSAMLEHAIHVTLLILFWTPSPAPPLEVGPDTTVIVEPLKPDGTPDYAAYLDRLHGEGVTPETNFAVDLFATMPAEHWPKEWDPAKLQRKLGLEDGWPDVATLPDLPDYIDEAGIYAASWTAAEHPEAAAWLAGHAATLDHLAAATDKPHYFVPTMVRPDEPLIMFPLPHLGHSRNVPRALAARATLRLGEGDLGAAWPDVLAMQRMGKRVRRGPVISHLVGSSISWLAAETVSVSLDSGEMTAGFARRMMQDLEALPSGATIGEAISRFERFAALDVSIGAFHHPGRFRGLGLGEINLLRDSKQWLLLDINLPLRRFNSLYDRLEAIAALPTAAERHAAYEAFEAQFEKQVGWPLTALSDPMRITLWTHGPWAVKRWLFTDVVADMLTGIMLPPFGASLRTQTRIDQLLSLQPVLIALAGYRAEHGAYPETLDALVPGWLDAVPGDLYAPGEPVRYVMLENKPAVYSVGPDGVDDAEKDASDATDDIGLRIGGRFDAHHEPADREDQP